jgi:hypothetical protein
LKIYENNIKRVELKIDGSKNQAALSKDDTRPGIRVALDLKKVNRKGHCKLALRWKTGRVCVVNAHSCNAKCFIEYDIYYPNLHQIDWDPFWFKMTGGYLVHDQNLFKEI